MAPTAFDPRLPAFLQQNRADLQNKFVDLEWQQRNRLREGLQPSTTPTDPPSRWARLTGDVVAARNRYNNVEPFAAHRIRLPVTPAADHGSDYINASPITLGGGHSGLRKRRYIATQGPKDTGVNHFYRMLAAELPGPASAVVVMLTQTHEAGREKCFPYFPRTAAESPLHVPPDDHFHDAFDATVDLLSLRDDPASRCQVRHLRLHTSGGAAAAASTTTDEKADPKQLDIHHLLFSGWPDFLVPEGEDRAALVELVRLSAVLNRAANPHACLAPSPYNTNNNSNTTANKPRDLAADLAGVDPASPRIVHCSAGVGRSGTFIALDYLLALLWGGHLDGAIGDDVDPIADTVEELRRQRMMMVQGETQFVLLYEVLREQWLLRRKSLDGV